MAKQHRLLSELAAIEQQLMQLVNRSGVYSVEQASATWAPAMDIYETSNDFVLTTEVPGVSLAELDVKVVENTLVLRGERKWERDVPGETYHRLENSYGKFERTFALSESIDADRISAELNRGVLRLVLPKRIESGKKIEIKLTEN